MRLTLPAEPKHFASWNQTLHKMLLRSGVFEHVSYSDKLPRLPHKCCGRTTGNLSVVALDGMQVAISTWDTLSPVEPSWSMGHWARGGVLGNVRMLLHIQWQPEPFWVEFVSDTGVCVYPWTVMPTQEWQLGCFRYDADAKHIYTASVTGAMRFGRGEYKDVAKQHEDFYWREGGTKDPWDVYVNITRTCKWMLSLKGKRGSDGKNRREIEAASCGMPLALNYQPHYPFEFKPFRDYFYLTCAEDMLLLRDIDPRPYAAAADQVYRDHWSPTGMAATFVRLAERCRRAQPLCT